MLRNLTPEEHHELAEALHNMLRDLPPGDRQIRRLAHLARIREVAYGEILMQQDTKPDTLYFILSGQLRVTHTNDGQDRLLNYQSVGDFAGDQAILNDQPCAITVVAACHAKLAVWDLATANRFLSVNPRVRSLLEEHYQYREKRAHAPFPGKHWDEVTRLIIGNNPMLLLATLLGPAVALLIDLVLLMLLLIAGNELPILARILFAAPIGLAIIVALLWGWAGYLNWRDTLCIVTSKRVIRSARYVLYGEEWQEVPLIHIQNVTVEVNSLWERMLGFCHVKIQTASAGPFVLEGIGRPEDVRDTILAERAKAMQRRESADRNQFSKFLAQRLGKETPDVTLSLDTLVSQSRVFVESDRGRLPFFLDYWVPRTVVVEGDTIIWRTHWFVLMASTWPALLTYSSLLGLLGLVIFGAPPWSSKAIELLLALGVLLSFLWYVYLYDNWHKNVYIVTRDRVVGVRSSSFRLRGEERREARFDDIKSVTYSIPGFLHRLLNMGSVAIEMIGNEKPFTFRNIFSPSASHQEIFNRVVAYQEKQ
jgi:hypothetical protein